MPRRTTIKGRLRLAALGGTLVWASLVQAAAPVEDRTVSNSPRLADLFYKMQQMQQEIMELRGQVEEQSYRIKRLEKQRLEDYRSLDKRMQQSRKSSSGQSKKSTASAAPIVVAPKPAASAGSASSSSKSTSTSASSSEREAYQQAFQLLKKQKLPEAESAFKDFLREYPDGKYSSNAYYWLGELYLTSDKLSQARKTFSVLVERYPDYRKTPDSTFKLAKIYYQQGDKQQSEQLLKKIVRQYDQSSPSTVKQANAYLDKHFR